MAKHVVEVELRVVVVAAVLAVAADCRTPPPKKNCLSGYHTGLPASISCEEKAWRRGASGRKRGGEERSNVRNSVWQFDTGNRKCRWHARVYPEQENKVILPLLPLEIWAPCKVRWVWVGAVIFASANCSLQFAEASAATLPQQEKNNSADVQRGSVNYTGFICTVAT